MEPFLDRGWLRLVSFILIYALLFIFLASHAKKVQKPLDDVQSDIAFITDKKMDKAMISFGCILGVGIFAILCSPFVPVLQDLTMIVVAVMFLVAGIVSTLLSGMTGKELVITFWNGLASIFPAVLMILMASSIKYTLEEAQVMDTILYGAVGLAQSLPTWSVILFIYLLVLVLNFFIRKP